MDALNTNLIIKRARKLRLFLFKLETLSFFLWYKFDNVTGYAIMFIDFFGFASEVIWLQHVSLAWTWLNLVGPSPASSSQSAFVFLRVIRPHYFTLVHLCCAICEARFVKSQVSYSRCNDVLSPTTHPGNLHPSLLARRYARAGLVHLICIARQQQKQQSKRKGKNKQTGNGHLTL